jgi:hypothetical protein
MDASVPSSVAPEEDMTTKRKQLWWSVLGMEVAPKRRPRLPAIAVQFLLGIVGLALITFVCFLVGFGLARTAFAYVILIALVSLLGSFSTSVVLSIIAVACLNYFFVPPLFEFRVDDPEDIVRMAAFLTTSLVVTALTTKRKRAEEGLAESRARSEEAQRLAHAGWWERDCFGRGFPNFGGAACYALAEFDSPRGPVEGSRSRCGCDMPWRSPLRRGI